MIKRPSSGEWKVDQGRPANEDHMEKELAIAVDQSLASLTAKLDALIQSRKQSDPNA